MDYGHPIINMAVSAGAVYVVRNPLDVVISFAHFSGKTIDETIESMATPGFGVRTTRDYVRIVTGSWTENVGSWTARPHPAVLVVRYEDLIADPTKHFGAVARHLLMAPTDEQLEKAIDMTGFERLRQKEAAAGFVERPDTDQPVLPRRDGRSVARHAERGAGRADRRRPQAADAEVRLSAGRALTGRRSSPAPRRSAPPRRRPPCRAGRIPAGGASRP